jgi:hypothetical protein
MQKAIIYTSFCITGIKIKSDVLKLEKVEKERRERRGKREKERGENTMNMSLLQNKKKRLTNNFLWFFSTVILPRMNNKDLRVKRRSE